PDLALADYTEAIRLNPDETAARCCRANIWASKGEWKKAVADLDEVIRRRPDLTTVNDSVRPDGLARYTTVDGPAPAGEVYRLRGQFRMRAGDVTGGASDFTEAIRIDPKNAAAFAERAGAFMVMGHPDHALSDLDRALELVPNAHVHTDRALVRLLKGKLDAALADCDTAVRLDPTCARAFQQRGALRLMKGDTDGALKDLNETVRLEPKNPTFLSDRSVVWMAKIDPDRAIADCDAALRIDPTAVNALANRGCAWLGKKEWGRTIADCEAALKLVPDHIGALANRGRARLFTGDWPGVLADLDAVLRSDPNNATGLTSRSLLRSSCPDPKYRDVKKARDDAKRLCELTQWKQGQALDALAAACAEEGQFDEAVKFQKRALEDATFVAGSGSDARERLGLYEQKKPHRLPGK
ncbi:MAG: tetratricopeptide repeat protein, partial [Planctomycetes bacterium]|nr:tetratricopeptide repeat protein [Planctomycetota bacterium]